MTIMMTAIKPFIPFASSAALALTLSQTMLISTALAAETQTAPAQTAQPAAPAQYPGQGQAATPAETARARAEERQAAMLEQRKKRYQDLRASAAEIGVEMPETPPWEAAWSEMPAMPVPPDMTAQTEKWQEDDAAMRQWREDMQARTRERMRTMTPEERQAMREERWKRMRAEAAERGVEMPETPPWVEAEKRRQEMAERFEQYRKTVEQMTDEQREAAKAVFGRAAARTAPPMRHHDFGPGHEPWGYPGHGPYQDDPRGMPYPPMMPYPDAPGED
jgi:hypothetical protein